MSMKFAGSLRVALLARWVCSIQSACASATQQACMSQHSILLQSSGTLGQRPSSSRAAAAQRLLSVTHPQSSSADGLQTQLAELAASAVDGTAKVDDLTIEITQGIEDQMNEIINSSATLSLENQQQVDRARDSIVSCDVVRNASSGNIAPGVVAQEEEHASCREEQVLLKEALEKSRGDLHALARTANPPACMQNFSDANSPVALNATVDNVESLSDCLALIASWSKLYNATSHTAELEFLRAHSEFNEKISECDVKQASFEAGYCNDHELIQARCHDAEDCRSKALADRDSVHQSVQVSETAVKKEHSAAEHVKCYIGVLGEANTSMQSEMFTRCKHLVANTSHLGIVYHEVPQGPESSAACGANGAKPCDDLWMSNHYLSKPWSAGAPAAMCRPCQGTSTPTTSTAAAATIMATATATTTTIANTRYQAGVPIADRYPAPPSGQPAWPLVVGQGSWAGMPAEKVTGGECSSAFVFSAYNMLWGCITHPSFGSGLIFADCHERTCPDRMWFTMDLGSVKNVKSITLKPETTSYYKSNHYELLISTDEPGPRGPYTSTPFPSFAVTSSGFQRVVDSGDIGSATNKEYTHAINQRARFVMFHALAWNNGAENYGAAGVEYLTVDAE